MDICMSHHVRLCNALRLQLFPKMRNVSAILINVDRGRSRYVCQIDPITKPPVVCIHGDGRKLHLFHVTQTLKVSPGYRGHYSDSEREPQLHI